MTTTITAAAGSPATTSPSYVAGYDAERASRNLVHDLISGGQAVVLIPAPLRSGTLKLIYPSRSSAIAALSILSRATTYSLVDTELTQANMAFVVAQGGSVAVSVEDRGFTWVVSIDFQEVSP